VFLCCPNKAPAACFLGHLRQELSLTGSSCLSRASTPLHVGDNFYMAFARQLYPRLTIHTSPQLKGKWLRYLSTVSIPRPLNRVYHWAGWTSHFFSRGDVFNKQARSRFAEFLAKGERGDLNCCFVLVMWVECGDRLNTNLSMVGMAWLLGPFLRFVVL